MSDLFPKPEEYTFNASHLESYKLIRSRQMMEAVRKLNEKYLMEYSTSSIIVDYGFGVCKIRKYRSIDDEWEVDTA